VALGNKEREKKAQKERDEKRKTDEKFNSFGLGNKTQKPAVPGPSHQSSLPLSSRFIYRVEMFIEEAPFKPFVIPNYIAFMEFDQNQQIWDFGNWTRTQILSHPKYLSSAPHIRGEFIEHPNQ
jgi:hypothetical protein